MGGRDIDYIDHIEQIKRIIGKSDSKGIYRSGDSIDDGHLRIMHTTDVNCEYWIHKEHQVCLANTSADCDLISPRPLLRSGDNTMGIIGNTRIKYKRTVYSLEDSFKTYQRGSLGSCR